MGRLGWQEGAIGEMRGQLQATERERAELQRRLAQASGQQAGAGAEAGTGQLLGSDLKKQLDMVHQQLAFKDQEVRGLQAKEKPVHIQGQDHRDHSRDVPAKVTCCLLGLGQ